MNTMAMATELADSGIHAVGSVLTTVDVFAPLVDDEDAHVLAYEAVCLCSACCGGWTDEDEARYQADARAIDRYNDAVANGTLPDGFSSLEDFGYVGPS
jgi:hypothetical protein